MINDFELLYMIRQKDDNAFQLLFQRYALFATKIVRTVVSPHGIYNKYFDEFCWEAHLCMMESMESYRETFNCRFSTYYYRCATRRVRNLIQHYGRHSNVHNLTALSLDYELELGENKQVVSYSSGEGLHCPQYHLKFNESIRMVQEVVDSYNLKDRQVLSLYSQGKSYTNAAMILDCTTKQYDNQVQKIKRRIRKAIT